jgi:hypothetical protein
VAIPAPPTAPAPPSNSVGPWRRRPHLGSRGVVHSLVLVVVGFGGGPCRGSRGAGLRGQPLTVSQSQFVSAPPSRRSTVAPTGRGAAGLGLSRRRSRGGAVEMGSLHTKLRSPATKHAALLLAEEKQGRAAPEEDRESA